MALKKEETVSGVRLRVNEQPRWGAGVIGSSEKENLDLYPGMLGGMDGSGVEVPPGTLLTVVRKPRRIDGRWNCCRVRVDGTDVEGEVYWSELRSSCSVVSDEGEVGVS